jgi:hypothetical protein
MESMQDVINTIDYDMLRRQKTLLLELTDINKTTDEQGELLLGIVHFIDAFQDAVVSDGMFDEQHVFGIGCNEGE